MTLLLSGAELRALLTPAACLLAVEGVYGTSAEGRAHSVPPLHLPAEAGGLHAKAARCSHFGRNYLAVKLNSNYPDNPARFAKPTIQGALLLFDADDGELLAVMDSIALTQLRTAAATALAARKLARADAGVLAICGCGAQAGAQVLALAQVRRLRRGHAWDIDAPKAEALASEMRERLGIPFEATPTLAEATLDSDLIVTCTSSRQAFLGVAQVRRGAFIAAVGADHPFKSEIAPELMASAVVVVDSLAQCLEMGDLHHAVAAAAMTANAVHAELVEVLMGNKPGRRNNDEITLFDSTGSALQDVACAAEAFRLAQTGDAAQFAFA